MNINKRRLSIIFIVLYLLGMIISAFMLFNFKNTLIYDLEVLTITGFNTAEPAFNQLHVIIGASMIVGLLASYFSFKANTSVVYVEKEGEQQQNVTEVEQGMTDDASKIKKEELLPLINPENGKELLEAICKSVEAGQGAFYLADTVSGKNVVRLAASYAMQIAESKEIVYEFGEGLIGQAAKEKKTVYIDDLPEGFINIFSGLGQSSPKYLLIIPVLSDKQLTGIIEIATFTPIRKTDIAALEEVLLSPGHLQEITTGNKPVAADVEAIQDDEETKSRKNRDK